MLVSQPGQGVITMAHKQQIMNARLTTQQTPLFIVELNQHSDRLNEAYQNGLKELAESTGGMTFFSRSTTEIPEAIAQSFSTVTGHYSLDDVEAALMASKQDPHAVKVIVEPARP